MRDSFSHVQTWVFDLDNTLYPPQMRLFDQIEVKMTAYVSRLLGVDKAEADRLRATYWAEYGTTLAGLMARHHIDPMDFLAYVHDIDFGLLAPDPDLRDRIAALPGRRIVYTNADADYAGRVLAGRGLSGLFDAIYGVEHADFHPKPRAEAFARIFEQDKLDPARAAMFEDDPRNLLVPHDLGMRTIHVAPTRAEGRHIQFHTDDLTGFLDALT